MRNTWTRVVALSVASVATFAAFTPDAFADRRSSLAGNLLITDQDDIYIYPQLTLDHRNLVSFDYFPGAGVTQLLGAGATSPPPSSGGQNSGDVSVSGLGPNDEGTPGLASGPTAMGGGGLLLFGNDNFAFAISSHREDLYGATPAAFLGIGDLQVYGGGRQAAWSYLGYNGPVPGGATNGSANPTGIGSSVASAPGGVFLQPLQLADVLMGFTVSDTSSMGARLSIGQASFGERRRGVNINDEESWNTTALDLVVGFTMKGSFQLDLNLELGLAFFSDVYKTSENAPDYNDSAALAPSFSLSGRSLVDLEDHVKLGVLALVHVNSATFNDTFGVSMGSASNPDTGTFSSSNVMLEAGTGPVYELPDHTSIAAYGTIGFGTSSYSDEAQTFNTNALLLPGFKLSLEHWIWKWLAFRSGISSRYYFTFQSRDFESDAQPNVSANSTRYEFLWTTGLGFAVGNFELNGTVQTPFVLNGPAVLSGASTGLWALLNAQYKF